MASLRRWVRSGRFKHVLVCKCGHGMCLCACAGVACTPGDSGLHCGCGCGPQAEGHNSRIPAADGGIVHPLHPPEPLGPGHAVQISIVLALQPRVAFACKQTNLPPFPPEPLGPGHAVQISIVLAFQVKVAQQRAGGGAQAQCGDLSLHGDRQRMAGRRPRKCLLTQHAPSSGRDCPPCRLTCAHTSPPSQPALTTTISRAAVSMAGMPVSPGRSLRGRLTTAARTGVTRSDQAAISRRKQEASRA